MKSFFFMPWLVCLSPLVLAATPSTVAVSPAQLTALAVQVVPLQSVANQAPRVELPAQLIPAPAQEQVLPISTDGVITAIHVVEGQPIKAGQKLLTLQVPALLELQMNFLRAAGQARLAQATLKRNQQLFAEGLIAEKLLLQAQTEAQTTNNEQQTLSAQLRLYGLDLQQQQQLLRSQQPISTITLTATISGQVGRLSGRLGQRVQAGDDVLHMMQATPLWLSVEVPLAQRQGLHVGQMLTLNTLNPSEQAVVVSMAAQASSAQTVRVLAKLQHYRADLVAGSAVTVSWNQQQQGWRVPQQAIVKNEQQQPIVFVRTTQGFMVVPVTVVSSDGQQAVINASTLTGQEQVASRGVTVLRQLWQGHSSAGGE